MPRLRERRRLKRNTNFGEVVAHVGTVGGSLMRTQQPPLGQRGDAVHGGQQLVGIVAASAGRTLDDQRPRQHAIIRARLYVLLQPPQQIKP